MRILSFDVGIKNLSYCLVDGETPMSNQIIKWGIWDLRIGREYEEGNRPTHRRNENITRADIDTHNTNITRADQIIRCCAINKNKKQCKTKPAFYECDENDNISKYYCKKHVKEYMTKPFMEDEVGKLQKMKKADLLSLLGEKNITIEYTTAKDLKKKVKEYSQLNCVHKIKKNKKCKNISMDDIHNNLYNYITNFLNENEVDIIQIENQPVKMNATMKTIQIMLYSIMKTFYYIHPEKNQANITFLNAKFKGTVYNGPEIECNITNPYKMRKHLSIVHTEYFLKETRQLSNLIMFGKHKKKDDLADAYLMGLYYLKIKN
jgi:hypothetical protein